MNSPILCIPFAGVLLSIALFPMLFGAWWEKHEALVIAFWIVVLTALCLVSGVGAGTTFRTFLECLIADYLPFIILLFGLYCVAGNITFKGDLAGSPGVNVFLLLLGTLLSSVIGTTGSSMLMIRPVIKMNSWRGRRAHIIIFFIFLVSNMGGCLTPIGDPPLLEGYMHGVPFFWSLNNARVLVLNLVILLTVFYFIDRKWYRRDIAHGRRPDISRPGTQLEIGGKHNVVFLLMIVGAILLNSRLSSLSSFRNADGTPKGLPLAPGVTFSFAEMIEIAIILLAAFLAFRTTRPGIRRMNHMTWNSIREVAILFVGIFITMQPALQVLRSVGPTLGIDTPAKLFWATGFLSSFLDNTPTYLVFMTATGASNFTEGLATTLGRIPEPLLLALSCGAVFMGAVTYIGNAPNFMVKSIADENGIPMPSFFGYLAWSLTLLIPVFLIDTLVFFL